MSQCLETYVFSVLGKYCISPIDSVISAKCDSLSTCIAAKDINSSYIGLNSIKYTSEDDIFWLSKLMKGTDLSYDVSIVDVWLADSEEGKKLFLPISALFM